MGQGQGGSWKPPEGPVTRVRCRCGAVEFHCCNKPALHFYEHDNETREWFLTEASPVEMVAWPETQAILVKGQDYLMLPILKNKREEETQRAFCARCWTRMLCRQKKHAFLSFPFRLIKATTMCDGVHIGSAPQIHLNIRLASPAQKAYLAIPSSLGGPKIAKHDYDLDPAALGLMAAKEGTKLLENVRPEWSRNLHDLFKDKETKIQFSAPDFLGKSDLAGKPLFLSPGCASCSVLSVAEQRVLEAAAEEKRKKKQEKKEKKQQLAEERRRSSLQHQVTAFFQKQEQDGEQTGGYPIFQEEENSSAQSPSGMLESSGDGLKGTVWFLQCGPESPDTCEIFYSCEQLASDKEYIFRVGSGDDAIGWRVQSTKDGKAANRLWIAEGKATMQGDNSIAHRRLHIFLNPNPRPRQKDEPPTVNVDLNIDVAEEIGSGVLQWASPVAASTARDGLAHTEQ